MTRPDDVVALGVDVGTTNTKAALVAVSTVGPVGPAGPGAARPLAVASRPTPDDAVALAVAVGAAVREVLDRHREATGRDVTPEVVGIASMAETGVPLDADGAPLTPLLRWDGHRAADQAAALARTHGAAALFAATGVRPSAKVPLATWAWLADGGVSFARWAGAADVVALGLTGQLVTDHTLAGRTMAYRAVTDGPLPTTFDPDLLDLVGLTPGQLPAVAAPDGVAGRVAARPPGPLGAALGLDGVLAPGTPVVVAGHDHAVGTWAAGVRRPGGRADSLGTAEAVLTVLVEAPEPGPVAEAGMSWVRTVSGRHHAVLAGSSSAGAMLGWLADLVGPTSVARALDGAARTPGDDGTPSDLLVLPYLSGRQTPAPDPAARVRVVRWSDGVLRDLDDDAVRGLAAHRPDVLARAVLEGVCLQAAWMLEAQRALGATVGDPGPLVVLGGAVRSVPAWAAVKRSTAAGPLAWVSAAEPVAEGAALLAAARAGLLGEPAEALDAAPALAAEVDERTDPGTPDLADRLARFVHAATGAPDPPPTSGGTA